MLFENTKFAHRHIVVHAAEAREGKATEHVCVVGKAISPRSVNRDASIMSGLDLGQRRLFWILTVTRSIQNQSTVALVTSHTATAAFARARGIATSVPVLKQ